MNRHPAKKATRESSTQPSTSDEPEVQPIILANPPIVFTRPKPILKFSVRTGNGEPITGALVDCALWTCPLDGCIVSIRERGGTEVVVEASASSAAENARCRLSSEGFAVQKLGVRAHFDCPKEHDSTRPSHCVEGNSGAECFHGVTRGFSDFCQHLGGREEEGGWRVLQGPKDVC